MVASQFMENAFKLHELPWERVSNKDTKFMGQFWQELSKSMARYNMKRFFYYHHVNSRSLSSCCSSRAAVNSLTKGEVYTPGKCNLLLKQPMFYLLEWAGRVLLLLPDLLQICPKMGYCSSLNMRLQFSSRYLCQSSPSDHHFYCLLHPFGQNHAPKRVPRASPYEGTSQPSRWSLFYLPT